jgi:hypothetical protein
MQHCELGCTAGACYACRPGSAECTQDGSQLRGCNAQGQWDAAVACEHGCAAGQCSECSAGEQRCTEAGAQHCGNDLRWQPAMACPAGCGGDQCAECHDGQRECSSPTEIRVCHGTTWGTPQGCRPHAHCDASAQDGDFCPCDPGYADPHPKPGLCGDSGGNGGKGGKKPD